MFLLTAALIVARAISGPFPDFSGIRHPILDQFLPSRDGLVPELARSRCGYGKHTY